MIGLWATLAVMAAGVNWAVLFIFLAKVIGAKDEDNVQ